MPVADAQVAILRALLSQDWEEHQRLLDQLDGWEAKRSYSLMVTSAFMEATKQRFNRKPRREIIEWVADIRARRDRNDEIDPNVAERLLLWSFGKGSVDDLDEKIVFGHQIMLVALLLAEQNLDAEGLEAFLQQARDFADRAEAEPE
jgi:hypothetical protein